LTYPTVISFTNTGDVSLKGVNSPPSDPAGYHNLSKYVNTTNQSAGAWMALFFAYTDGDLGSLNENTLFIARNNGTWETNNSIFANQCGVNTTYNQVYCNITDFGSDFGPLGKYQINITFITPPTPVNDSRNTANNATIRVNVTSTTDIDTCVLEWDEKIMPPPSNLTNNTMTMIGSGTSVLCEINMTTIDGVDYWYKVYANVTAGDMNVSETRKFRENAKPTKPVLEVPADESHITNRTHLFNWTESTDSDGDSIQYIWNLTCYNNTGQGCSPVDNRLVENITNINYTPTTNLKNFWDTLEYYNWTVKAYDGYEFGDVSDMWRMYLDSLVAISTINDTTNFGTMSPGTTNDTTTNNPWPISMQNDGNCFVNVSLEGTSLWTSDPSPTSSYQFKMDLLENNSFNWSESITTWTNVPTGSLIAVNALNHSDTNDSAELDIKVAPPSFEPYGTKSSTITLTGAFVDVAE
jgi:hypothetical protein